MISHTRGHWWAPLCRLEKGNGPAERFLKVQIPWETQRGENGLSRMAQRTHLRRRRRHERRRPARPAGLGPGLGPRYQRRRRHLAV